MRILLSRISAPGLAAIATAALCAAFWLPFGPERLNKTTYNSFDKLVTAFAALRSAASAGSAGLSTPDSASLQDPAARLPGNPGSTAGIQRKPSRRHSARKDGPTKPLVPSPPLSPDKRPAALSPIEGIPVTAPPPQAAATPSSEDYTPDSIRDTFEAELAKFPLDAKLANDRVILRLEGLCRWRGHYILKVAVDNQTGSDFFVKELSAYAGSTYVTLKSYFRLLVEPGRTRVGHVLFDAPAGAKIKIALTEDRENGRVMEVPVRYPF